jgi:hypothetical protein
LTLLLLVAVLPTTVDASIWVTNGARAPTLRVDALGMRKRGGATREGACKRC